MLKRFQLDFNTCYVFHAKFVNFKALWAAKATWRGIENHGRGRSSIWDGGKDDCCVL